MDFQVSFKVNDKIYLRNPESSEIGRKIVKSGIDLIYELGFEHFTFRKLSQGIGTTEATVYRYFENKHRLLLYIICWYWNYLEFLMVFQLQNVTDNKEKIRTIIRLLNNELPESSGVPDYNKEYLNQIVISESSKVYLVKDVNEINSDEVYKPYKDLCNKIAEVISMYNPRYQYPRSLSSTIVEMSHYQQFFSLHLPGLTEILSNEKVSLTVAFLEEMVFKVLG